MLFKKNVLALALAACSPFSWAQLIDSDADLLIDIASVEDLEMMRLPTEEWQALCLTAPCRGFELVNDINFDTDGDGSLRDESTWNDGRGFFPLEFDNGIFEGNHHSILNLSVNLQGFRSPSTHAGFFSHLSYAVVRNVNFSGNLTFATSDLHAGILAGFAYQSTITNVRIEEGESRSTNTAGGLIGSTSYSTVVNSASNAEVSTFGFGHVPENHIRLGGLIGAARYSTIERSMSDGAVLGMTTAAPPNHRSVGAGLVGELAGSNIIASYSNGLVAGGHVQQSSGLANLRPALQYYRVAGSDGDYLRITDSEIIGSFSGSRVHSEQAAGFAYVTDFSSSYDYQPPDDTVVIDGYRSARNNSIIVEHIEDIEDVGAVLFGNLYFGSIANSIPVADNFRVRNQTPQLARDPSLEVDNYWVRNTALEDGEIEPLAGAYSAQDLKCPTIPGDPNCGDGTLYAGWDLIEDSYGERIWYFGEGNETPFLYTKSLYPWQDNENPGGNGDYETRARIESNDPDNECLDDEDAQIEAKIPGSGVVIRNNYPDVLASFNLRDGLICQNSDQTDGSCGDYEVSYMCGPFWTQWESRDTPNRNSDAERRDRSNVVCSNPTEIRARLISDPDTIYYGPHDRLSSFSANEGLVCRNGEQGNSTCSNYAVRLTCDIKGQPRNQRDI